MKKKTQCIMISENIINLLIKIEAQ